VMLIKMCMYYCVEIGVYYIFLYALLFDRLSEIVSCLLSIVVYYCLCLCSSAVQPPLLDLGLYN
jgi:hypothetical protein